MKNVGRLKCFYSRGRAPQGGATDQFKQGTVESEKPIRGIEAYVAIADLQGKHYALAAPTVEALAQEWNYLFGTEVDEVRAQHVLIIQFPEQPARAPETLAPSAETRGTK